MYENDYENDRPATIAEAVREWTWVVGAERPDSQWLLSGYDTWERNPHYTGPDQRHPESYDYEDVEPADEALEPAGDEPEAYDVWGSEDIPF